MLVSRDEHSILICGEDSKTCSFLKQTLHNTTFLFHEIQDIEQAIQFFTPGAFQTMIIGLFDSETKGKISGLQAISIFHKIDPRLPIIAMAHTDSIAIERQARLSGVFYYLTLPLDAQEIKTSVWNAIKQYERLVDNE